MSKVIKLSDEARNEMFIGATMLYDCVSPTFGPGGRNVILEDDNGQRSTKDGVSVAKSLTIKDPFQNAGIQIIKSAASESNDSAGDGTTTSIVLAHEIIKKGLSKLDKGVNVVDLKRGIDKATKYVISELTKQKKDIKNKNQIKQVGTISSNNDEVIGTLIAQAFDKVSLDGAVIIEDSKTNETWLEIVDGMQFNRGYLSPYFVTNNDEMHTSFENPYILLYDGKISAASDGLIQVLDYISKKDKPLLIIADDIEGQALAALIVNKVKGLVSVCAVKTPEFGDRKKQVLEDIAILTGAQVITKDKNQSLDGLFSVKNKTKDEQAKVLENFNTILGSSRTVTVTNKKTTIVSGDGNEEQIKVRTNELQRLIENTQSPYEREQLQVRFSKLSGGIAILHIGAETELEMGEKKDRVEDALNATQSAIKEGILPGGGLALMKIKKRTPFNKIKEYTELNEDQKLGFEILVNSIDAPFNKIINNMGQVPEVIWNKLENKVMKNDDYGYDLRTNTVDSMFETGIIDPFKVTRIALEKAVSVAGTFLTTEVIITNDVDDKKDQIQYNDMM